MDINKIKERSIQQDNSLLSSLKQMDILGVKSLLVINENDLFVGILSIGDIQRAIIRNVSLESSVSYLLRPNPRIASPSTPLNQIKQQMVKYRMEIMPVVDKNQNIVRVYFWEDLFLDKVDVPVRPFDLPVVIMAGGFGTRLKPFTNVLPKPLFPYDQRTIIEEIIDRFINHGCSEFYISAYYKADILKYYLNHLKLECILKYIHEKKPLGTAGSLSMLKDRLSGTFIVTNCDILIQQDYSEILDYHRENKNAITIVATLKHFPIPYGILETKSNGLLATLQEKPELTFKINSGMYILESAVLKEIPKNTFYHITQLIKKVHAQGNNVGVFPVSEGSWKDIGDLINRLKPKK